MTCGRRAPTRRVGRDWPVLAGDALQVEGSTIALLRLFSLIEKDPRSVSIVTPPG